LQLDPTYGKVIEDFIAEYKGLQDFVNCYQTVCNLKLTLPWKIHMLCHIVQFLSKQTCGLGIYSEQCSEAAHCDMKPTMKRFKRKEDNIDHGRFLKNGVVTYSSRRVGGKDY
jgi:hypothetical protein